MRLNTMFVMLAMVLAACRGGESKETGVFDPRPEGSDTEVFDDTNASESDTDDPNIDADGDGYPADEDCDDEDPTRYPGNEEACDEVDNDCDTYVDEGARETFYADADGDGYGDEDNTEELCFPLSGYVDNGDDCDDSDATANPDAAEICDGGVDNDCNGWADDDDPGVTDASTWYADADDDGYGTSSYTTEACEQPDGYAELADDCDDSDAAYNPGASEDDCTDPNDYNCDGSVGYTDDDGDGYAACEECDDADATVNPDADEVCDGVDNDCDGTVDNDDATDASTFYADSDGDGYGDATDTTTACDAPSGYVSSDEDCDDSDSTVSPDAEEVCDEIDNDCDGTADNDDATDAATWYLDADSDGFGNDSYTDVACDQPSGYAEVGGDCDDGEADNNPDADEVCDEEDNDCDGATDEEGAIDATTYYADDDSDGYGDVDETTDACDQPVGYVEDSEDCDDDDSSINPDGLEVCDSVDNDCDGTVDNDDAFDADTWYADADGDGYGYDSITTTACEMPSNYVDDNDDCDDGDSAINPDAEEVCDGVDNDCDGIEDNDDATDADTWYYDYDSDGYGDASASTTSCDQPSDYVDNDEDCDDRDPSTYEESTFYEDADGDGYGNASSSQDACEAPSGYVDDDSDCDDTDASLGAEADYYVDADGDGYGEEGSTATTACEQPSGYVDNDFDCDDADSSVTPDQIWYADDDGDGYGDASDSTAACGSSISGYVDNDEDCDDSNSSISPDAEEVCSDSTDNDCDGDIDEECPEEHCGYITSDETWEANDYGHVVTCSIYISGSSAPTLTVEDGAEVYFDQSTVMYVGYPNYGDLVVEGTSSGVLFSSNESSPAAGDYYGVYFYSRSSSASDIEGLTLEYAGLSTAAMYMYYAEPTITASTIQHSDNYGIYSYVAEPLITDTTLADNGSDGLFCASSTCLDDTPASFSGNVIEDNGSYAMSLYANNVASLADDNTMGGNGEDFVRIISGTVSEDATWYAQDIPYFSDYYLYVYNNTNQPVLTLDDGVEIAFDTDMAMLVGWYGYGDLVVDGHTEGVTFTSAETSPAAGDWGGLWVGYYADDTTAIDGLTVEYAGSNASYPAGMTLYYTQGDTVEVTNSTFRDNDGHGVYLYYYVAPSFDGNTFEDNTDFGLYSYYYADFGGDFTNNVLTGNGEGPMAIHADQVEYLDDSSTYTGNGEDYIWITAGTSSSSVVATDATWEAMDAPYRVTHDIYVYGTGEPLLSLEDGVELYFEEGAGLIVGTGSGGGNLAINGDWASGSGVLLSAYDSTTPGSWDGVYLGYYSDDDSVMTGFTIEYGGDGYPAGLYLYGAEVDISDCLITENEGYGIYDYYYSELSMSDCEVSNTASTSSGDGVGVDIGTLDAFSNNVITGNDGYPMVISANDMKDLDEASTYSGNGDDYVHVNTYLVSESGTWSALDVPFLIDNTYNYINVYGSSAVPAEITVDGAELHFAEDHILYVGWSNYGDIYATDAVFTSAESSAAAGDWAGIRLGYYTSDSEIDSSEVSYGGGSTSYPGNITCYYCTADITDNTISYSQYYGIYAVGSYSVSQSGNTFTSNGSGDTYPTSL